MKEAHLTRGKIVCRRKNKKNMGINIGRALNLEGISWMETQFLMNSKDSRGKKDDAEQDDYEKDAL